MARAKKRSAKKPAKKTKAKPTKKAAAKKKPASKRTSQLSEKTRKQLAAAQRRREQRAHKKQAIEREELRKKKKREKKAKARARQHATRARKGGQVSLLVQLEDAFATMQDLANTIVTMGLAIEHSPVMERGQQPWLLLGRFVPEEVCTWKDIGRVFELWDLDPFLPVAINPQRYTFMRVVYQAYDDEGDPAGKPEGFAPTNSGAWERVISEAVARTLGYEGDDGEPDADALATRYANAAILEIQVLWSASLA